MIGNSRKGSTALGRYTYAFIPCLDIMSGDNGGIDVQDLAKAQAQGRQMGKSAECRAGMCPYGHDQFQLRSAWMDGFSDGRKDWRPFPSGRPIKRVAQPGS